MKTKIMKIKPRAYRIFYYGNTPAEIMYLTEDQKEALLNKDDNVRRIERARNVDP